MYDYFRLIFGVYTNDGIRAILEGLLDLYVTFNYNLKFRMSYSELFNIPTSHRKYILHKILQSLENERKALDERRKKYKY